MNVDLRIDSLVLATDGARRIDTTLLKVEIERRLAILIKANGLPSMSSLAVKTVAPRGALATDGTRREARLGRELAQRIYQGMKR